jgi:hypothetical protein
MAMSKFGAAYKAARDAGKKDFTFNGKKYTTESREEKADRMATNQRQKMAGSAAGAGRGSSAGRGAGDAVTKEREPIRMEGLERMKRGLKEMGRARDARIEMDKTARMAAEDDIGMGMKKGGVVKKRRDGIAQRGKTKGRMC